MEAVLLGVGEPRSCCARSPGHGGGALPRKKRPGLHHVAYGTDDIESALEAARSAGLRLIDERPRTGIRQSRCFRPPEIDRRGAHRARGAAH